MQITRRNFGRSALLALACVSVIPATTALSGCNTSWLATAEADVPTITTILQSTAAIALEVSGNGALEPVVANIISVGAAAASVGLATLQTLLADYKASPNSSILAKIEAVLADVSTNLTSVLSTIKIKDPDLIASISAGFNLAISVISGIQLLIPSSALTAKMQMAGKTIPAVTLPSPSQLKRQYNTVITAHGFSKHTV